MWVNAGIAKGVSKYGYILLDKSVKNQTLSFNSKFSRWDRLLNILIFSWSTANRNKLVYYILW